jgi:hypothetical protein
MDLLHPGALIRPELHRVCRKHDIERRRFEWQCLRQGPLQLNVPTANGRSISFGSLLQHDARWINTHNKAVSRTLC